MRVGGDRKVAADVGFCRQDDRRLPDALSLIGGAGSVRQPIFSSSWMTRRVLLLSGAARPFSKTIPRSFRYTGNVGVCLKASKGGAILDMLKRYEDESLGRCGALGEMLLPFSFADKRIAVLLATFNGTRFLERQISTIARQTAGMIDLWVSDDGSTDGSRDVLEKAARSWKRGAFHILTGPGCGFAENFRSLMLHPHLDADYVAFCDQDDEWDHDKLEAALSWLARQGETPALYCSRTRIVSSDGRTIGLSPLFSRPPDFRNALVQNIAGGNTMVMNRAAWRLVRDTAHRASFVSHDWWCYLIVTGAGGVVYYSSEPKVSYRQHDGNLVGENSSWRARLSRIKHLMRGRFREWNSRNLSALKACCDVLTPSANEAIALFTEARSAGLLRRLQALRRSGVYRQTLLGEIGLLVACITRRL